jgi:pyruvate dehydrogenase E2 component (dihydrolipoamide acetyltransferase)
MPIPITMPALSPTMTEGTLAKWLKAEGDTVASGDVIAEIETDKATMEIEAIDDGTLGRIVVPEGTEGVAVNAVIAVILAEGEDTSALESVVSAPPPAPTAEPVASVAPAPAEPAPTASPAPVAVPLAPIPSGGGRMIASPLARRMAAQANIDLAALTGSGPKGRIVKLDIEAAMAGGTAAVTAIAGATVTQLAPTAATAPEIPPGAPYTEIPTTQMRRIIARRLTEAKSTVPHFYLTIDCEVDRLLAMRKDLNARAPEEDVYKISVNDFVIRASALALHKVPAANSSWTETAILQYNTVDVSVAVAIEGGLITPIIRNADQKGLAVISNEMKELAGRAQKGKLTPEEYQGGTFSISNLGMYSIREFAAVINPPHGAILAVGKGEQRPIVKDGALAIATVMTCTLSCDHRVVDGAIGAELLAAFKGYIEDPVTMLL